MGRNVDKLWSEIDMDFYPQLLHTLPRQSWSALL